MLSLAELLAQLLTTSKIERLERVPAEQYGLVWRFLVRSTAQALHDLGGGVPAATTDADALAGRIADALERTAGGANAFALFNPQYDRPAFLQPPLASAAEPKANDYRRDAPSRLIIAVGSKHHERKVGAGRLLDMESLAYALIAHQLGVIFVKGSYASQLAGSATGKGSGTPYMGVRLPGALDRTFRHDVATLLDTWRDVERERGLKGDVWALWTLPWDGTSSLGSEKLTPAFIPCARLIRLGSPRVDGLFDTVWFKPTKAKRVEDRTEGSGLGDPFLPLVPNPKRAGDMKARGAMETGYRYDEVVRLLFGGEEGTARPSPTVASMLSENAPGGVRVVFEGMAFDQGKTLGFHRRELLLPEGNLLDLREPDLVRSIHGEYLRVVKDAQAALRGAARILLNGAPKPREGDKAKIDAGAQALQRHVDDIYPDALLEAAREKRGGVEDVSTRWVERIRGLALEVHREAQSMLPVPATRRLQREVEAESYLRRKLPAAVRPSITTEAMA
ncbi:MAG: hypothetical protein MUF53_06575 [Gemmatimonadaceae bacterium]|jgi:hypothetical protein|nr:hypothetical protein [Gemmatimonadaceae bacterium]